MGRREQREQIFKLLFRVEFHTKDEMPLQCSLFFEDEENPCTDRDREYIQTKLNGILEELTQIDELIRRTARGWTLERMGKVELTLIRLAVYEMRYDDQVPEGVAINEAVELAKKYGQDGAGGFVNGVLAKLVSNKA